ncbi:hypothetical protein U9M48_010223 [Paspalum notatum var. saurae]|uniref:Uncharacterized protein n=1 Tax=Paspalum notatum var. saurae TaxID=547442 RepID=A0AAQ3STB3_PASNO
MEAAASAKPRRQPPPIPPHYVSLRKLQELRLKEQEEKRRREEEEAAAKREAEAAAAAAAIKRDAALKEAAKGRAVPWETPDGAKERHRGGQGHQWVPSAHRAPAATPRPTPTCGEVAAVDRGRAVGGGRGKKGKGKASPCHTTVDETGKVGEAAPASSNAGKPEDKSKPKAKGKASGDQTAQSRSSGGRRRQVVEVRAVAELNPRDVRKWDEPRRRDRGIEAAEQHGRVWVPKAAAATGSSAGAGL